MASELQPRKTRSRTIVIGLVIGGAALAVTILSQVGLGSSGKVQIGNGSVSEPSRAARAGDGSRQVVGLVGDGHTYAEANGKRTRVENNTFLLRDVAGSGFTIGSASASQTIELGD